MKEIVLKPGEELFHADKHPSYKPFFKQVMTGVPKNTVKKAMERKFLDPTFLDNPKAKVVYRPKVRRRNPLTSEGTNPTHPPKKLCSVSTAPPQEDRPRRDQ